MSNEKFTINKKAFALTGEGFFYKSQLTIEKSNRL